ISTDTSPTQIYTLSLHDALPISLIRSTSPFVLLKLTGRCPKIINNFLDDLERQDYNFRRGSEENLSEVVVPCFFASKTAREETRSEEHTSELQSRENLVCRLLLE